MKSKYLKNKSGKIVSKTTHDIAHFLKRISLSFGINMEKAKVTKVSPNNKKKKLRPKPR